MPGGPPIGLGGPVGPGGGSITGFEQEEPRTIEEQVTAGLPQTTSPETEHLFTSAFAAEDMSWRQQAAMILREQGAPMDDAIVKEILNGIDSQSERFDDSPAAFDALMAGSIQMLQQSGALSVTPYSQSLSESGFGYDKPEFNALAQGQTVWGSENAFLKGEFPTEDFVVNPTTGWKQYKNGTLVNPNYEVGNINAVIFDPQSRAPGSSAWLSEVVPSWSPGKINEWRSKLIEGGYLPGDMKKGSVDATFLNAMRQYQAVRYQNGGTPMAIGPRMEGATGTTPFNFKQLSGQIDNGVREMWNQIYGTTPHEDEIEPVRQMIIETAHKLYQKGQMSSSQAMAEAEERAFTKVGNTPEAQFVTENLEENTQLRDNMLRAVQVTSMMA